MFRSFNSIQSPINATRQGNRDYIKPQIYFYSHLFDRECTSRGTQSCSSSQDLLSSTTILNDTSIDSEGFFTGVNGLRELLTDFFQIGIDWVGTDIFPDHHFDTKFILTIERYNNEYYYQNTDLAVTQEVLKETTSNAADPDIYGGDYNPYDVRDGNTSWGDDDRAGVLHSFRNIDLLNAGYLYYAVIPYPSNWDPTDNYYGADGLRGFTRMGRSFIWIIYDEITEGDEPFVVRLRSIPNNLIELEDNLMGTDSLSYQNDFITRESESKVLDEGIILSEVKFKIVDYTAAGSIPYYEPITDHPNISGIASETSYGVIGLPPVIKDTTGDFVTGTYNSQDDFEGVIGNSGWNYPGIMYSPYLYSNSNLQFEDPDNSSNYGRTKYLRDHQANFLQGNLPSGPLCYLYKSSTFVSFYTRSELESIGMTTDSRIRWFAMDQLTDFLISNWNSSYYATERPSIHVAHVKDTGTSPIVSGISSSSDPIFKPVAKYPGTNVGYGTTAQNGATLTDMNYLDVTRIYFGGRDDEYFLTKGQKVQTVDGDFFWDGESHIAIIWSFYNGFEPTVESTNPYQNLDIYDSSTSRFEAPLFRMGKTYYTDTNDAGGSFMYLFGNTVEYGIVGKNFRAAYSRPEVVNGEYQYQFNNSPVSGFTTNFSGQSYKDLAGQNMISIPARPIIQLGYDNPSDIGPEFYYNHIPYYNAGNGADADIIRLYLLDNNYDNEYFEKRVIPITFDLRETSGAYPPGYNDDFSSFSFQYGTTRKVIAGISTFRGTYQIIIEVSPSVDGFNGFTIQRDNTIIKLPRGAGPLSCSMDHRFNDTAYTTANGSYEVPDYRSYSSINLDPIMGWRTEDLSNPVTDAGNMVRNNWLQAEVDSDISEMSNYPNSSIQWNYVSNQSIQNSPFIIRDVYTTQLYGEFISFDVANTNSEKTYLLMNASPFRF